MPRKRRRIRRSNHVVSMIVIALLIISFAYLFRHVWSAWDEQHFGSQTMADFLSGYQFAESIRNGLFSLAIVGWVFVFGSAIGSFLNVVVYRMPRGESLNRRASHCQFCDQPIRLTDNLPVIGWIRLRGRCRVCRLPISSRYPIVEFLTGAAFVMLFLMEIGTGGKFLPFFSSVEIRDGFSDVFGRNAESFQPLLGMYAIHMLAIVTLWPAFLIERDRNQVPVMLLILPMLINLVVVSVRPQLLPVEWFVWLGLFEPNDNIAEIARHFSGLIGWFVGVVLGLLIGVRFERSDPNKRRRSDRAIVLSMAMGLVGSTFGWQTVCVLSLPLPIGVYFARAFQTHGETSKRFDRFGVLLFLVIGGWIFWQGLFTNFHQATHGLTWLASAVLALLIAASFRYPQGITDRVFRRIEQPEPPALETIVPVNTLETSLEDSDEQKTELPY